MRKAPADLNMKENSRLDNITLSTERALAPAFMRRKVAGKRPGAE